MREVFHIRQLEENDLRDFRTLRLAGLQESPTAFGASFAQEEKLSESEIRQRIIPGADRWILGAFDTDTLIGLVGFVRDGGDKSHHKGFLWGMYVAPNFRGRGVGRDLLIAALARIDATPGLRCVRLSVVTTNRSALHLYEVNGFVRYGEEPEALKVGENFHAEYHLVRRVPVHEKA